MEVPAKSLISTELARTVVAMMMGAKRIYNLIIKIGQQFSFLFFAVFSN